MEWVATFSGLRNVPNLTRQDGSAFDRLLYENNMSDVPPRKPEMMEDEA